MATQPSEPSPSSADLDKRPREPGDWNAGDTNLGDRSLRAAANPEDPYESDERQRVEVDMNERPGWQTRGSERPADSVGFDQERFRHGGFGQSGASSGYGNQRAGAEPPRPGADQVHGDRGYGNQSYRDQTFGGDHGYGPKGSGSGSGDSGAAGGEDASKKEKDLPAAPTARAPRP